MRWLQQIIRLLVQNRHIEALLIPWAGIEPTVLKLYYVDRADCLFAFRQNILLRKNSVWLSPRIELMGYRGIVDLKANEH